MEPHITPPWAHLSERLATLERTLESMQHMQQAFLERQTQQSHLMQKMALDVNAIRQLCTAHALAHPDVEKLLAEFQAITETIRANQDVELPPEFLRPLNEISEYLLAISKRQD